MTVEKSRLRISGHNIRASRIAKDRRIWDGSDGYLQFSTEAAANDYILMNKPCLNIKVLQSAGIVGLKNEIETLKKIVQAKSM